MEFLKQVLKGVVIGEMCIRDSNNISFDSKIKLGEDALFLAKYYRYCNSIRCISDRLYHYVPNAMSAVHNYQAAYWEWEEKVVDAQWKMFHQYPLTSGQEQAMLSLSLIHI